MSRIDQLYQVLSESDDPDELIDAFEAVDEEA